MHQAVVDGPQANHQHAGVRPHLGRDDKVCVELTPGLGVGRGRAVNL